MSLFDIQFDLKLINYIKTTQSSNQHFLTNKSVHLVDCSELHFMKVQFHMAPLMITKFITKHLLAPWWESNMSLSSIYNFIIRLFHNIFRFLSSWLITNYQVNASNQSILITFGFSHSGH